MTVRDTGEILAVVRMLWPHSTLGGEVRAVVGIWHALLERFARQDVEDAVKELAVSGREHAPLPGMVVKVLAERATDLPDWDQAWDEIDRLIRTRGYIRPPEQRHFSHPLIAAFAIPAWRELCAAPAPGTNGHGTHHAQQREAYKAAREREQRNTGLAAIGAPRHGALRRLDASSAAHLPRSTKDAA